MSSIVVARRSGAAPDQSSTRRMLAAAPHRGAEDGFMILGDVALAISNGPTKWASLGAGNGWACALLGPIDNSEEVARLAGGAQNPAEAVALLFALEGEAAVDRLRGAFAGVASNGQDIFCFRDHLGGRPLFFRHDGDTTWVATEAKQVVAGAGMSRQPDLEAIELMFYRGIGPASAVKGVDRVFYGEVTELRPGNRPVSRKYWHPEDLLETRSVDVKEAPALLAHQLQAAVERTVAGADAVALSGGIDSPLVAAFAAPEHLRRSGRPLSAYTAIYPRHLSVDEFHYTSQVAEYLQIELKTFEPRAPLLDNVEHWVDLADGPWDSLPMSTALEGYRLGASMGAHQVLTGTLAEYVFTINRFLLGHTLLHGQWSGLASLLKVRRQEGRSIPSLTRQLLREITPAPVARSYARLIRRESTFFPAWVDSTVMGGTKYSTALGDPARKRWVTATLGATRGTTSTQEAIEICASTVGVVVRHPLADRDLWDFFLSLPVHAKFPDTIPKSILRTAMRGRLPDTILDRRDKTVFDEHVLDTTPWQRIGDLITDSEYQMPGVDYDLLASRIAARSAGPVEIVWANDLATVHAFIKLFR